MRKSNLIILVIGLVGAVLMIVMYAHVAESDPQVGARMKTARLLRSLYRFQSAVVSQIGEGTVRALQVKLTVGDKAAGFSWDEAGLRAVAQFVDVNYLGDRKDLREIRVRAVRETGAGCSKRTEEIELANPYPVTPPKPDPVGPGRPK